MTKHLAHNKLKISIAIIWISLILVVTGIKLGYESSFVQFIPYNICLLFFLILWHADFKKEVFYAISVPFIIGTVVEYFGVNYELIFGKYNYGETLGFKILGVPIIIGIYWTILVFATASISRLVSDNYLLSAISGAVLMTSLDILIEVSAPRFQLWEFQQGYPPLQKYAVWFFVSLIIHLIFQKILKSDHFMLSFHIFTALTIFFSVFIFL